MKRFGDEFVQSCKREKVDTHASEVFINYMSEPPPLQTIALVSVAVGLWGDPDMKKWFPYNNSRMNEGEYRSLEESVIIKLNEIVLPDFLKTKISNMIRSIGLQLLQWFDKNDKQCGNPNEIRKEGGSLYWTMDGVIDKVRSIKEIIYKTKDLTPEEKDFSSLYQLACGYCLEEYIPELYLKVKNKISASNCITCSRYHITIHYWNAFLKNDFSLLWGEKESHDKYRSEFFIPDIIKEIVMSGNVISLKYFWHKLSETDKEDNIERWIDVAISRCDSFNLRTIKYFNAERYHKGTDILCFLLSRLNSPFKQREMFRIHSETILKALLLHGPWQRFFPSTIKVMFDFLHEEVYVGVMSAIALGIEQRAATQILLREVWLISPHNFKMLFFHFLEMNGAAVIGLMKVGDDATLDMIFTDASDAKKKRMLLRMAKHKEFHALLRSNESSILMTDTLISKHLLTDSYVRSFKRNVAIECQKMMFYFNDFRTAHKLFNWAFPSPQEMQEFKQNYANPALVYSCFMFFRMYDLVDIFLKWYFETEEEILEFKNDKSHLEYFERLYLEGDNGVDQEISEPSDDEID